MKDLKQRAMRGGLARIVAQMTTLFLRTGSLMVMARLLTPEDFGLVGMVTATIGIFSVFRDFGLSAAAVQQNTITEEQSSTLFWINLAVGVALCLLTVASAPLVAHFYHQQRLIALTAVMGTGFVFNAAGVQHTALLERRMRFVALSLIDIVSLAVSVIVGITLALRGFGYWALVATSTITPLVYTTCSCSLTRWVPGRPRRNTGMLSMMKFGGSLTLNGLISYIARNLDKILLGRFWGAVMLGVYGRGYQLVTIPTENLNSAAGGVVFAALSRLQDEPQRMRSYFLKSYSLLLSLTVPVACLCALFGDDIVHLFLGPKWNAAIPVFRLLTPVTLGFAILVPLTWLLAACGQVTRSLHIALALTPVLIAGYTAGLHWGLNGVAIGYSASVIVVSLPLIAWAASGTPVRFHDLLTSIAYPFLAGIIAAAPALAGRLLWGSALLPLPRLAIGTALYCCVYLIVLLYVFRQKQLYLDIVRAFADRAAVDTPASVSI